MDKWRDKLSEDTICSCFVSCGGRFALGVDNYVCISVCVCSRMAQSFEVRVEINAENIVAITTAACK